MTKLSPLHALAHALAVAGVARTGLPNDEGNARALAQQAYMAARLLLQEGEKAAQPNQPRPLPFNPMP